MNYDQELQRIITAIKADKSIVQPWKNKIVARLDECQAFIDRAHKVTYMKPPEGMSINPNPVSMADGCICPPGGQKSTCPVHGWAA